MWVTWPPPPSHPPTVCQKSTLESGFEKTRNLELCIRIAMTHEDDMIFLSFSILHLDLPVFCHYFPPWMVNWSRCPQVENSETMEVISFNCGTCIRLPRLSLKNGPKPSGKRAETNHPIVQGLFFFCFREGTDSYFDQLLHDFIEEAVIIITRNSENKTVCSVYTKSSISFLLIWRGFHSTIFFRSNTNYLAWTLAEQVIW